MLPRHGIWDGARLDFLEREDAYYILPPEPPGDNNAVAVDSRGRVYVLYRYGALTPFRYKDPSGIWSNAIPLPYERQVGNAGVLVTPDDTPHFFYVDGGDNQPSYIVHATYNFTGSSWSIDTVAASSQLNWNAAGRNLSIGSDSLGGLHVSWPDPGWNDDLQINVDQIHYAENTTGTWREQLVSDIGAIGGLLVEPSGRVYIIYLIRRDDHNYIILTRNRFRADTIWTADSTDTEPAPYSGSRMQRGHDGSVHVLFLGRECYVCPSPRYLHYTKRSAEAATWEEWTEIFYPSGGGILRLDCEDNAHILHMYYHPYDISWARYYSTNISGHWSIQEFYFGLISWQVNDYPRYDLDPYNRGHALFAAHAEDDWYTTELYYYSYPSVPFDAISLAEIIDYVYLGQITPCGFRRYDQNCDEKVDALDVEWLIEYLFAGGPWGCR